MEEEKVEIKEEVEDVCDLEECESDPNISEDERNLSRTKKRKYERNDKMSSIPIRKSTRRRKQIIHSDNDDDDDDDDDGESLSDDQHSQLSNPKTKVKQEKLASPADSNDSAANTDDDDSGSGFELIDEDDEESLTDDDERRQSPKRKKMSTSPKVRAIEDKPNGSTSSSDYSSDSSKDTDDDDDSGSGSCASSASPPSPEVKRRRKTGVMKVKRTPRQRQHVCDNQPEKERYSVCHICGSTVGSQRLNHHLSFRHGMGPNDDSKYLCSYCPRQFLKIYQLNKHCRVVHNEKNVVKTTTKRLVTTDCSRCPSKFDNYSELKSHVQTAHPNNFFLCQFCDFLCYSKPTIKFHYKKCYVATRDAKKDAYNNVDSIDLNDFEVPCEICERKVKLGVFSSHLQLMHGILEDVKFKCLHCPKQYFTRSFLVNHCDLVHGIEVDKMPLGWANVALKNRSDAVIQEFKDKWLQCPKALVTKRSSSTARAMKTREERRERRRLIAWIASMRSRLKKKLVRDNAPSEQIERKLAALEEDLEATYVLREQIRTYENGQFKTAEERENYFVNRRNYAKVRLKMKLIRNVSADKMEQQLTELMEKYTDPPLGADGLPLHPFEPSVLINRKIKISKKNEIKIATKKQLIAKGMTPSQAEFALETPEERARRLSSRYKSMKKAKLKASLIEAGVPPDEIDRQLDEFVKTYVPVKIQPRTRGMKNPVVAGLTPAQTKLALETPEKRARRLNYYRLSDQKIKLKNQLAKKGASPEEIERQLAELKERFVPVKPSTNQSVYKPSPANRNTSNLSKAKLQKIKELMGAGMTRFQAKYALETPEERAKRLNNIRLSGKKVRLKAKLAEEGASQDEIERQLAELEETYVPVKAKSNGYKPKPSRSSYFNDDLKTVVEKAKKSFMVLESQVLATTPAPVLPQHCTKVKVTQPITSKSLATSVSNVRFATNEAFNATQNSFGLPWLPKQTGEHIFEGKNVAMNPPLDFSQLDAPHQFDVDNNDALDTPTHSPEPFSHVEVEESSPPQCNDLSPQSPPNEELCVYSPKHESRDPIGVFNEMMPPCATESTFTELVTQLPSTSSPPPPFVSTFPLSPTITPMTEEYNDIILDEVSGIYVNIKREKREREHSLKRSHKSRNNKLKMGALRNVEKEKRLVIYVKRLTDAAINANCQRNDTPSRKFQSFESHTAFEPDTDYAAGTNRICHICGREVAAQYLTYHIMKHCADDDIEAIKTRHKQPPVQKPTPKLNPGIKPNCSRCSAEFNSLVKLKSHVKAAHPDNYFPCPFCSTFRYTKEGMITHLKMFCHRKNKSPEKKAVIKKLGDGPHLANYVIPCELCEKPVCLVTLRNHLKVVHIGVVEDPLECFYCECTFTTRLQLADHTDFVHGVTIDKLPAEWIKLNLKLKDQAKRRSDVKLDLTQHGWSNWSESSKTGLREKIGCSICGVFIRKKCMAHHVYTIHGKEVDRCGDDSQKSKCSRCFKEMPSADLKAHVERAHPDKYFPCPLCPEFRYNKESILTHMKGSCWSVTKAEKQAAIDKLGNGPHLGNYMIPCVLCEGSYCVRFFQRHLATVHDVVEEPIKCLYCHKHFSKRLSLADHMDFEHGVEIDKLPVEWIKLRLKDETIQRGNVISNGAQFGWNLSALTTPTLTNASNSSGNASVKGLCDLCGVQAGNGLQKHIEIEHGGAVTEPRVFLCSQCPNSYKTAQGLKYHGKKVHKTVYPKFHVRLTVSECSRCPSKFENPSQLKYHVETTHPNNYFPCPFCDLFRYNKPTLRFHIRRCRHATNTQKVEAFEGFEENENLQSYKVPCEICENEIPIAGFSLHLKRVHHMLENKKMKCLYCARDYSGRDAFADHIDYVHGVEIDKLPEGWYKLNLKDRSDKVIQGLKDQYKKKRIKQQSKDDTGKQKPKIVRPRNPMWTPGAPSTCDICGVSVIQLNCHMSKVHARADHKNWVLCPKCPCRYKTEFGLQLHVRKVHDSENKNIRRFKIPCELCGFSVYLTGFETHLKKVHEVTEDKKLICFHCPQEFNKRMDFVEHVDSEHGGDMFKFPEGWSNVCLKNRSDEVIQQLKDKYVEVIAAEEREGVKSRHFVKGLTKPIRSEKKLNVSKKEHFPLKEELNAECSQSQDGSDEETGSSEEESSKEEC